MTKKKNYKPLIWTLTIVIYALVAILFFLPDKGLREQWDFSSLPLANASLNALTFASLALAWRAVKRKNIYWHKRFVLAAFFFTSFFLISYLLYHYTTPSTHYGGSGLIKYVYYFILLTHIFFAAIIVPLALFSMGYGLNMEIDKHLKIVKWSMPIWLYVSVTGVLVYLMLLPYY